MNKIKVLALIICIALLSLIFFTSGDNNNSNKVNNNTKVDLTKENVEEVLNNGKSVLKYNGYIYYIKSTDSKEKGFNNKLCRRKINNSKEEILYDAENRKIGDRLIIFNNNIFFNIVGQTYYVNLENVGYITEYNNGVLYYIGNGNIIYAHNNSIFKATYYLNTLAINSINEIATFNPNFMFEDEEYLYFYSNNVDGSKSVISINKEKQTIKVLNRFYPEENRKLTVINYKNSDNYIYLVLDFGKPEGENFEFYDYRIVKISKKDEKIESCSLSFVISDEVYIFKDSLYFKYYLYENDFYKYDHKENKISKIEKFPDKLQAFNVKLKEKNILLCKAEEDVVILLKDSIGQISNSYIEEVEDYLYIRVDIMDNNQREIMQWRVKKDGSNLERLNNN